MEKRIHGVIHQFERGTITLREMQHLIDQIVQEEGFQPTLPPGHRLVMHPELGETVMYSAAWL